MNKNMEINALGKWKFQQTCSSILKTEVILSRKNSRRQDIIIIKKNGDKVPVTVSCSLRGKFLTKFFQTSKKYADKNDKYAFVDLSNQDHPRFFILTYGDVDKEQRKRNIGTTPSGKTPNATPYDGVDNLEVNDLLQYEDQWHKLMI